MSTLSFALGMLCGAVATFAFVYITAATSMLKKKQNTTSPSGADGVAFLKELYNREPEMFKDLLAMFLKEAGDDGGKS